MMAPARNLLRRHCDSYGSFFDQTGLQLCERSDLMAEKAASNTGSNEQERAASGEAAGSYQGWLQLGTGASRAGVASGDPAAGTSSGTGERPQPQPPPGLTRLAPSRPTLTASLGHHPWWFWSPRPTASGATMAPPPMPSRWGMQPSEFLRPSLAIGSHIRVVSPPPRPQAGMWLLLKAAQNQTKEPLLPQIPKSYLRIKDGTMTARILLKYLANKLGLEDGSEVQLSCRGQQIPPPMTLHQVRDQVWRSTEATVLLPPESASITDHLITLHYSRSV
ncbi:protein LAX PANICLE 2-like [Musa acuminata AAA Group]|uniref:protein LAX PANICLE 2-like n=1 Tax=Musa acuminata AAA Group TaxID=214697 RepID=UPI0031D4475E